MTVAPWYLLAAGIGIILFGFFIAVLGGGGRGPIDPKMSDKEIARRLKESHGSTAGRWVMLLGLLVVLLSIAWRIVRIFVTWI